MLSISRSKKAASDTSDDAPGSLPCRVARASAADELCWEMKETLVSKGSWFVVFGEERSPKERFGDRRREGEARGEGVARRRGGVLFVLSKEGVGEGPG